MSDGKVKSLHLLRQMPGVLRSMLDADRIVYGEALPIVDGLNLGQPDKFYLIIARGEAGDALEEFMKLLVSQINDLKERQHDN